MKGYFTYRYIEDGRTVEAQYAAAHKRIAAGVAQPATPEDEKEYIAWLESEGMAIPEMKPVEHSQGQVDEEDVPDEDDSEDEGDDEEEGDQNTSEAAEVMLPDGYTITQYGNYYVAKAPNGEKLGKGKTSWEAAAALAVEHSRGR